MDLCPSSHSLSYVLKRSEHLQRKKNEICTQWSNYMTHCSVDELRTGLANATKETHNLWEENKDLQARHSMTEMQRRASQLYSVLTTKREEIVKKLNDGTNFVALLQNQLISERLFDWKNRQKLAQVGVPFDNRDVMLDEIQMEFEFLAEQNWQLHMFASWTLDLLTRGPQVNDSHAHSTASNLTTLADQLTKLLFMLISQSFVRLLIGDKLGIRQHLVNTNVTVKIIAEEEAKLLSATQMNHKDIWNMDNSIKTRETKNKRYPRVPSRPGIGGGVTIDYAKTVGSISNDYEKMTMDERGHMAAKFNNSKLTRIAHRKPPPKGAAADMKCSASAQAATDQKYALLFHISPFQLGNLGKSRSPGTTDITAVAWKDLAHVLRHKFTLFTGARRPLSDSDLNYLSEKLLLPNVPDQKPITFHRFAKQNLRDDVSFSFWEWFFSIMQLIKQKLLKFWDEGWLVGFISKQDASQSMMLSSHPTFLLRFSDTQTGAVSIGFVCEDDDGQKVPFHLAPFSIKDLDQLSLAQRIASCPQLKEIK
ncbi:STAT protein, DNA binding domain protein [Ancylostoma ceylanicum]|uniref:STAT protein, DNA binding domain protein n=1 Tax=Ancylostoma ceylanicum TaxID=53326 RepID=A0A0D6L6Y8_9BILA|nr:STAT protein, DNA binding domain protein [Ancylostoma ceylanicum]